MMICPKCNLEKSLTEYYEKKSHKGSWCKACMRESCRKWARNNPGRSKANKRKFNAANKEKIRVQSNARVAKWIALNPERLKLIRKKTRMKYAERRREQNKVDKARAVERLSDSYVRKSLGNIAGITGELIELQRIRLQIHRILKERK